MTIQPFIKEALDRAETDSAFEGVILWPLHEVSRRDGNRRYLLIDALDEAVAHPKPPTIVEVLGAHLDACHLLGIIAITRGERSVLSQSRVLPPKLLRQTTPKTRMMCGPFSTDSVQRYRPAFAER